MTSLVTAIRYVLSGHICQNFVRSQMKVVIRAVKRSQFLDKQGSTSLVEVQVYAAVLIYAYSDPWFQLSPAIN